MPKLNQKGVVAPVILLILLAAGIFVGVWLITNGNPLKLFSRASSDKIDWVISDNDPDNCVTVKDGQKVLTCPKVKFKVTVPQQVSE